MIEQGISFFFWKPVALGHHQKGWYLQNVQGSHLSVFNPALVRCGTPEIVQIMVKYWSIQEV